MYAYATSQHQVTESKLLIYFHSLLTKINHTYLPVRKHKQSLWVCRCFIRKLQ